MTVAIVLRMTMLGRLHVGVRSSCCPKASVHIHGVPTGAACTFMMRPTTAPSASTSKSSSFHSPEGRETEARLRISEDTMRGDAAIVPNYGHYVAYAHLPATCNMGTTTALAKNRAIWDSDHWTQPRDSRNGLGVGNGGLFRDAGRLAVPRANSFGGTGDIFGDRRTQPIHILRHGVRLS